jgi:FkbM family methyltransferase
LFRKLGGIIGNRPIVYENFQIQIPPNMLQVVSGGVYEPVIGSLIKRLLSPGDVAVDGGAFIGLHTLTMAGAVGPSGKVHSFEPAPDSREFLYRNVTLNSLNCVQIHAEALGRSDRQAVLFSHRTCTRNSLEFRAGADPVQVNEVALDHCVQGAVRLIKLDLEGHELEAIAGMKRILSENPGIQLIVEWNIHTQQAANSDIFDLPLELFRHGFLLAPCENTAARCSSVEELSRVARVQTRGNKRVNLYAGTS